MCSRRTAAATGGGAPVATAAEGLVGGSTTSDTDDVDLGVAGLVELDLVDHRVEAFVVRSQGLQDLPHDFVAAVARQPRLGGGAGGDADGQDDVPVLFGIGFPHHPADGLHHIHLTVSGVEKNHCVKCGNIYPLAQAARVGEDTTHVLPRLGFGFQPIEQLVTFEHIHGSVDVLCF